MEFWNKLKIIEKFSKMYALWKGVDSNQRNANKKRTLNVCPFPLSVQRLVVPTLRFARIWSACVGAASEATAHLHSTILQGVKISALCRIRQRGFLLLRHTKLLSLRYRVTELQWATPCCFYALRSTRRKRRLYNRLWQ